MAILEILQYPDPRLHLPAARVDKIDSATRKLVSDMAETMHSSEGVPLGIKANAVNPGAFTRMVAATLQADSPLLEYSRDNLPPELSSPAVAFLSHESCPVTGECIESVGGEVFRHYMARTPGINDRAHTIETLAARWDEIMAGASDGLIGLAGHDTSGWKVRPYAGEGK